MDVNQIEPVTQLKSRSAELIRQARETRQPIIITQNGRATAVLMDAATYQQQQDTLAMLRLVAQGVRELDAGLGLTHEEAILRARQSLAELRE